MTDARVAAGWQSIWDGEFGESWLKGVAAGSGILQGRPFTLDLWKTDVLLAMPAITPDEVELTVRAQVKTTTGFRRNSDNTASIQLDRSDYNALTQPLGIKRLLVVVWLASDGDRVRIADDGTLLVGHSAWISLEGEAQVTQSTKTVRVPLSKTVDPTGLRRMLTEYGRQRSTEVAEVSLWPTT